MKVDEITHLASLARLRLSEAEKASYGAEIAQIVEYVSAVSAIAADEADMTPQTGARYNVLREDEVTNQPDQFTQDILREMPRVNGRHMEVHKILKAK